MNRTSFSLYKLPLLSIAIYIGVICFKMSLLSYDYYNERDILGMLIITLLPVIPLNGFWVLVYHYFKINCFTYKNILFVIIFVSGLFLLDEGKRFTLFYLADQGYLHGMAFYLLRLLTQNIIIAVILIMLVVKLSQPFLDQYQGAFPLKSSRYWRLANMWAIGSCYSGLVVIFQPVWSYFGIWLDHYIDGFSFVSSLTISVNYFMLWIYLLILLMVKSPPFKKLYFREIIISAITLILLLTAFFSLLSIIHLAAYAFLSTSNGNLIGIFTLFISLLGGFVITKRVIQRIFVIDEA